MRKSFMGHMRYLYLFSSMVLLCELLKVMLFNLILMEFVMRKFFFIFSQSEDVNIQFWTLCAFHTAATLIAKKNFFLKGSKRKNGKNRYKSIQIYTIFCKTHVSTPSKNFFVEKKFFLRSCEIETSMCEHPLIIFK